MIAVKKTRLIKILLLFIATTFPGCDLSGANQIGAHPNLPQKPCPGFISPEWVSAQTRNAVWNTPEFRNNINHVNIIKGSSHTHEKLQEWHIDNAHRNQNQVLSSCMVSDEDMAENERRLQTSLKETLIQGFWDDGISHHKPFNAKFKWSVLNSINMRVAQKTVVNGNAVSGWVRWQQNLSGRRPFSIATIATSLNRTPESFATVKIHEVGHAKGLGESLATLKQYTHIFGKVADIDIWQRCWDRQPLFDAVLLEVVGPRVFWQIAYTGQQEYSQLWNKVFNCEKCFNIVSFNDMQLARAASLHLVDVKQDPNISEILNIQAVNFREIVLNNQTEKLEEFQDTVTKLVNHARQYGLQPINSHFQGMLNHIYFHLQVTQR